MSKYDGVLSCNALDPYHNYYRFQVQDFWQKISGRVIIIIIVGLDNAPYKLKSEFYKIIWTSASSRVSKSSAKIPK